MADERRKKSMADLLAAAGIVSPERAAESRAAGTAGMARLETQARDAAAAAGDPDAITQQCAARLGAGVSLDALEAATVQWVDQMRTAGHADALRSRIGDVAQLLRREGTPADAAAIDRLEGSLGARLAPSHRRLLGHGSLAIGRDLVTCDVDEIRALSDELATLLDEFSEPPPELSPGAIAVPVARIDSDFHCVLRRPGDAGESPVYLVLHDEGVLYGGTPNVDLWLVESTIEVMEAVAARCSRG